MEYIIVGGGLAGIAAARELERHKKDYLLIEAGPCLGGRVGTDFENGFILDHGFQIILDSYPELNSHLNLEELDMRPFHKSAILMKNYRRYCLWKAKDLYLAWKDGLFCLRDLIAFVKLAFRILGKDPESLMNRDKTSVASQLKELGFSKEIRQSFWNPFLSGIFLDNSLNVSGGMLMFVLRMLWDGTACVPKGGMKVLVDRLAESIPKDKIRLNSEVRSVNSGSVTLSDKQELSAKKVVLCLDIFNAHRVMGVVSPPPGMGCTTLYFKAPKSPVSEPALIINSEDEGLLNHMAVMSDVSKSYAPEGQALIAATVLGTSSWGDNQDQLRDVVNLCKKWFGDEVGQWKLIKTSRILNAHPANTPDAFALKIKNFRISPKIFIAGDYLESPSIQSALRMGRLAAVEAVQAKD